MCISVGNWYLVCTEYINKCRKLCRESKVILIISKIKRNVDSLISLYLLEKKLLIGYLYTLIASCSECRISLIDSTKLYDMLVKVDILTLHISKVQAWTEIIVRIVLLASLYAVLASVIDRRDTRHGVFESIDKRQISRIVYSACDTVHIVVVNKVVEVEILVYSSVHTGLTVDRIVYLKVVLVVVGGVYSLVALVVCNAVEHFRVSPAVIVAVDYLAHEPEVTLLSLAEASDALEEVKVDAVGCVEAYSVDAKGFYPVVNSVDDMVTDTYISEIELDEVIVTVPAFVPERISARALSAEVEILEPVTVLAVLAFFLNIHELREFSSYVVENAVKNNSDAVLMESVAEKTEGVVITESAVYLLIVNGIIAVFNGFKDRSEVNSVNVHFL
jgi:hypothetical protein